MTTSARTALPALVGLLLGLLSVLAVPAGPAYAHANFLGSDPAEGTILAEPPERVVLSFSEPVQLIPGRTQVVAPDGEAVHREPSTDGSDLVVPLARTDQTGTYLVTFRVVSMDSHPVAGSVTFSVGAPSPVPSPVGPTRTGDDPVVVAAQSVVKYVGYTGLVLTVGPALMLAVLWPRRLSRRGVGRLLWAGVGLVAAGGLAGLLVQAPYQAGTGLFEAGTEELRAVLASQYGSALLVRLAVVVAVALLLRPLLAGRAGRVDLLLLAGLGVVGLGTWPVAGHPAASPVPYLSVVLDTVHLAAAAAWMGGLVVLVGFLLRRADQRELAAILPEWSRWAGLAVSLLLLAGLVMAVIEVGVPEALTSTRYGQLLLAKVGLVALVVAVAAYSRRLVRRHLAASRPGRVRTAVAIEAGVLAVVLGVASVLTQTTPARTASAGEQVATTDYFTTLETDLFSLQVLVEPGMTGTNMLHLTTYGPDGQPLRVEEWGATAEHPAAGIGPVDLALLGLTDNHAVGQAVLPVAGEWEFRFTIRVSEIDQRSVEVAVPIT